MKEMQNVIPISHEDLIDVNHRNKLQIALMREMVGIHLNADSEIKWIEQYAKSVHEIIDNPENSHIREMILNDKIDEVLPFIIDMLENGEIIEQRIAA